MTKELRNCKVTILDSSYILASTHSEELVKQSATLVDSLMREIAAGSPVTPEMYKVAVLAAIRLAGYLILLEKKVSQGEHIKNT
jgi:cell division protein ZapA (FtsZ GTPase activity inhibitor)